MHHPPIEIIRVSLARESTPQLTPSPSHSPISCPRDAVDHLTPIALSDREQFAVLHLIARNVPRHLEIISIGSLSATIVHPRECFKAAVLQNSASLILAHNHPSGDPAPSQDDIDLTFRLQRAGHLLGIDVLDHIIVSPTGAFCSLKEEHHIGPTPTKGALAQ